MRQVNIEALKAEVAHEMRTTAERIVFTQSVSETKILIEHILSVHRKLIAVIETNQTKE